MAKRGKQTRRLSESERTMWTKVAATAKPLPGRMEALLSSSAGPEAIEPDAAAGHVARGKKETVAPTLPGVTPAMKKALARSFSGGQSTGSERQEREASRRHPNPIEKPVHRKLARGRLALDGRLDLHGLDQADAHARLAAFLSSAHRDGLRHVLVITGKGASFGSEGALRRAVPAWLALPAFRTIVSGYEWAARGHGGEGALYVRLKRRREVSR